MLLLLLANILGGWACASRAWHGSEVRSILATAPLPIAPPVALPDPPPRAIDFSAIQRGALFYASRTFYVPPAIPPMQPPPDYQLAGTLLVPQQPAAAMLVQPRTGKRAKVRAGDDLEGWTVASVEPNVISLRHGDQQIEIRAARAQVLGMQRVALPAQGPSVTGGASDQSRPAFSGGIRLLGRPLTPAFGTPR